MILNISNNTDIVQFFTPWLMQRFEEGCFGISMPKSNYIYQLNPQHFEVLIFQTKNPKPILPYIKRIEEMGFKFFFIITVNPYDNSIEKNIDKSEIFDSIKKLSKLVGPERIIWKYAPVILNSELTPEWHYKYFNNLCKRLKPYVSACIVDFLKDFEHPIHAELYTAYITKEQKKIMLSEFQQIVTKHDILLCYKNNPLGFTVTQLLKTMVAQETGIQNFSFDILDMGLPNTCLGNCEYCCCGGNKHYKLEPNLENSPLFIGEVDKLKKHTRKKAKPIEIKEDDDVE